MSGEKHYCICENKCFDETLTKEETLSEVNAVNRTLNSVVQKTITVKANSQETIQIEEITDLNTISPFIEAVILKPGIFYYPYMSDNCFVIDVYNTSDSNWTMTFKVHYYSNAE